MLDRLDERAEFGLGGHLGGLVQSAVLRFFNTSVDTVLANLVPSADVAAILGRRPFASYEALHAFAAAAVPPSQLPQLLQRYQGAVEDGHDIDDLISQCEALSTRLRAAMGNLVPPRRRAAGPIATIDLTSHVSDSDTDSDPDMDAGGGAATGRSAGSDVLQVR